ncbi:PA0069 family radical SAM protein [Methylocystis sp. SB2]|uniref:PA0069 family radical SAM protein n=1 Tax=Methylocystis sp. (strain SB2) TaxID=743836 RepID=UPI00041E1B54|nr:PA0069 family radical SAM protein [Methylocystis sp. SB2]ULO22373.1 PA0069 family radical SAM protein [Methylocystis sp. SB2]
MGRAAQASVEIKGAPQPIDAAALIDADRRRGRGALSKRSGRFEKETREEADDGWGSLESLAALKTNFHVEKPRTIITRNDSPDISFDRSINPYRGCEHGCVYCFARPTHAYMGFSPGLDFETEIFVKEGAAQLLERELSAPRYVPKTIAIGTNTDPYQPAEKSHRIMRSILEVLARANHPVGIVTKSALVLRDLDLLAPMAAKGLAKVAISVTTLERKLARLMEPRAATPELRLDALEKLSAAGVPTAVMTAPIIPAINDDEIERILTRAHAAGAREAGYVMLRLPLELRDLFTEWLATHFPDRARRALALVRSTRDGKLYDASFGTRMKGEGPYAWMIGRRFELAAARLGFAQKTRLRTDLFEPPRRAPQQLNLF